MLVSMEFKILERVGVAGGSRYCWNKDISGFRCNDIKTSLFLLLAYLHHVFVKLIALHIAQKQFF